MIKYRVKLRRNGMAVLQERRCLIFWATLNYGTHHTMTSAAIQLERARFRRLYPLRKPSF